MTARKKRLFCRSKSKNAFITGLCEDCLYGAPSRFAGLLPRADALRFAPRKAGLKSCPVILPCIARLDHRFAYVLLQIRNFFSGAEARPDFKRLTVRVNSCPDTNQFLNGS